MKDIVAAGFQSRFRQDGLQCPAETISLDRFLSEAHAPKRIDYMSIDVEGSAFNVRQSFDCSRHDIALISVEHNFSDSRKKIYNLLTDLSYRRQFRHLSLFDDWYARPDLVTAHS